MTVSAGQMVMPSREELHQLYFLAVYLNCVTELEAFMRGKSFLAGFGLVLLVLLAYFPVTGAETIWDDDDYLSNNPLVRTVPGLVQIWTVPRASPQYYPVVFTSFWLEFHLWGLNYPAYHLVNVILHGLNAVLVWRILKRLDVHGAWPAAAIFALHPVHVESVAWIAERKNVLSAFFFLCALRAYLKWAPPGDRSAVDTSEPGLGTDGMAAASGRWSWYVLAFTFYLAALGSKTVSCSFPAVILLIMWWKREELRIGDRLPLVPFFAVGLAAGLMTAWLEVDHVGARGAEWAFSATDRVLIAGRALCFYAEKLAWPTKLMFIYPRWRIDATDWREYVAPLAVLVVLAGLWLLRHRIGRALFVGVAFFCTTLFPALGFFNIYPMRYSFVADHFQYLPSLGLIASAAAVCARVLGFRAVPHWGRGLFWALVLLVLGMTTLARTPAFMSTPAIWRDTLDKNPTSVIANTNLGQFYRDRYDFDRARPYLEAALRADPDCLEAHYNLGAVMEQQGDLVGAERELSRALQVDPQYWRAHFTLGLLRRKQGRLVEAAEWFRSTLRINAAYTDARKLLARIEGEAPRPDRDLQGPAGGG